MPTDADNATRFLLAHLSGKEGAADMLVPLVYDALHNLAQKYMHRERRDHTLSATALVHEAYMRLIEKNRVDWKGRTHFCAIAAKTMRQVLVNYGQAHRRKKRGGGVKPITLHDVVDMKIDHPLDVLVFDELLSRLEKLHPRQARVVELRFFGSLTEKEVAQVLDVSTRTVKNDWRTARAWLLTELDLEAEAG
jgi:RNA polymerase sigma factor (TIGR02999 family)